MKNFKKIVAGAALASIVAMNVAFAAQVGTGTYTDTGATSPINWDSNLPGTASGTLVVDITAKVEPTISFNLTKSAIDFGSLVIGSYKTGSLDYTSNTNAVDGLSISVRSFNLLKEVTEGDIIGAGGQAGTDYKFAISATPIASGTSFDTTDQLVESSTNKGPVNNTMEIGALIAADTTSGNYTDTLTYTVTGNF